MIEIILKIKLFIKGIKRGLSTVIYQYMCHGL